MTRLRSFRFFLTVLVGFSLLVLFYRPSVDPLQDRITHLTHSVRCPSCEALSVAQSNATSSLAIRREIASKVRAGVSDAEILTSLQVRYGEGILLSPSSRGAGAILWITPAVVLLAGGLIVMSVGRRGP
mgnify:FL=1